MCAVWVPRWLDELGRDCGLAVRTLARRPLLSIVIVTTLGVGLGATGGIYTLVDQLLLKSLRVRDPEALVLFDGPGPYQGSTYVVGQAFSAPMFRGLRDASADVMDGVFARFSTSVAIGFSGRSERVSAELVSGDYFPTLGVAPALGRALDAADDRVGEGHPVVVLSHGLWERRFGASPGVLNQTLRINGTPMTVVGVASKGFIGVDPSLPADVFVPMAMKRAATPEWDEQDNWRARWVTIMGRLKSGVRREQAEAALNVAYRQLLTEDAKTARLGSEAFRGQFLAKSLDLLPGHHGRTALREQLLSPLTALMSMVALVLLLVCANVANLLLASHAAQQKEVSVRMALGAGRFRIARQRFAESLVLAAIGSIAGILIAWWTASGLLKQLALGPAAEALSAAPGLRVALVIVALATVTALLFGIAPALYAARVDASEAVKDITRSAADTDPARVRRALVVAQVALAVLLLTGAGLFARSLYDLRQLNPGFDAENVLQFRIDPTLSGYAGERADTLLLRVHEALTRLPGVVEASRATIPLMGGRNPRRTILVQGYTPSENEDMNPHMNAVGPGYFHTLSISLLEGREFTEYDARTAPRVAIVNETMAAYFWKGQNPIGKRLGFPINRTGSEVEVVGVVRDAKFANLRDPIPRFVYVPTSQWDSASTAIFYVRARSMTADLPASVMAAIQTVDPDLPVTELKSTRAQVDNTLFVERILAMLAVAFGAVATGLAAIGLYGVTAYSISRRTAEIGVRMALGAQPGTVLWMVLREVLGLLGVGVGVGVPITVAVSAFARAKVVGLAPADPLTIAAVVLVLTGVAFAAGYLPAWRAARVNPAVAFRQG